MWHVLGGALTKENTGKNSICFYGVCVTYLSKIWKDILDLELNAMPCRCFMSLVKENQISKSQTSWIAISFSNASRRRSTFRNKNTSERNHATASAFMLVIIASRAHVASHPQVLCNWICSPAPNYINGIGIREHSAVNTYKHDEMRFQA